MKLFSAVILLFPLMIRADMAAEKGGFIKKGACIESRNLGYTIVRKINNHSYELAGDMQLFEPHALLKTKEAIFDTTGHPIGISMKRTGEKNMKLANGFDAKFYIWEECKFDEKIDMAVRHNDPKIAWPRVRKKKKKSK